MREREKKKNEWDLRMKRVPSSMIYNIGIKIFWMIMFLWPIAGIRFFFQSELIRWMYVNEFRNFFRSCGKVWSLLVLYFGPEQNYITTKMPKPASTYIFYERLLNYWVDFNIDFERSWVLTKIYIYLRIYSALLIWFCNNFIDKYMSMCACIQLL